MALGLRLRVTNTQDKNMLERTFDRFPVRIGRNPLNDFQIDSPFVSQFHAVLELQGNSLMLRDLGSKNGTMIRGSGKVTAHQLIDLNPVNFEFAISSLFFQAFPAEVDTQAASVARKKGGLFLEGSMPASMMIGGTAMPPMVGSSPAVGDTMGKLKPMYDAYRAAWGKFYQDLCVHAGTLDPASRASLLEQLNLTSPAVGFEPDFQRLAQVFKANLPPTVGSGAAKQDEMLALQAVKELAQQYAPNRSIEGSESIVQFVSKVQDTLDVFLKCFIPLRDGYKQFESKMEIKRMTAVKSDGKKTVETAKDPKELGQLLLDPMDPSNDGPRSIEGIFADLMIHQVAMLDGVMRGVKSLLRELSPREIENLAEKKKVAGSFFGKNYESLWKVYGERHSDLADEDKEAFGLIFGPQFVQAYTQLSDHGGGGGGGGGERVTGQQRTASFPTNQSALPPANVTPPLGVQMPPKIVAPPKGNPDAPNPFEWPPPPAGGRRGG